ncbi:hypothetical protein [Staphylococcus warneri]|uniref:hypothetical protein n=2 Tax=Staphylococcus TaxID=1279 RepID=UPI001F54192E|nr:hypothetical protein [Staphylococcus warneri]
MIKYMLISGKVRNQNVIERLKKDIYQVESQKRKERQNERSELYQKAFDEHLEQVKEELSTNRKVLAMP